VLFDKIASVYTSFEKYIYILALVMETSTVPIVSAHFRSLCSRPETRRSALTWRQIHNIVPVTINNTTDLKAVSSVTFWTFSRIAFRTDRTRKVEKWLEIARV